MSGMDKQFEGLPGAEIVTRGLQDLTCGRITESSLLTLIAAHNLRRMGVPVPDLPDGGRVQRPYEHRLYELIATKRIDSHSYYNSLLRRLVSFEQALAARNRNS